MHLEHVNLTVADAERSAAFYRDLLGFTLRWKGELPDGRALRHVGDDRHYLALFEADRAGPVDHDYDRVGVNHFGFVVDNLDAARDRLIELGVTQVTDTIDYAPGRRLYFHDPDDYEVELVEY
jgi:catechol 2,3-dioxygenase-like lactoylglutathione lyase family enzyme